MISLRDYYNGLKMREAEFPAELCQRYEAILWDIENILNRTRDEGNEDG